MSTVTVVAGDTTTETEFYVTVESQDLFAKCFPLTVQQFEQDTATKRKGTAKGIRTSILHDLYFTFIIEMITIIFTIICGIPAVGCLYTIIISS